MHNQNSPNDPVIPLHQSGFRGPLYIPTEPKTAEVVFVWWASTPQQRQAKQRISMHMPRLRLTSKLVRSEDGTFRQCYVPTSMFDMSVRQLRDIARERVALPRVPRGYSWHGPYLYAAHERPIEDSSGFRFQEPELSEELSLGHLAVATPKHELALQLARKILSSRQQVTTQDACTPGLPRKSLRTS